MIFRFMKLSMQSSSLLQFLNDISGDLVFFITIAALVATSLAYKNGEHSLYRHFTSQLSRREWLSIIQ